MHSILFRKAAYLPFLALSLCTAAVASPVVSVLPTITTGFEARNAEAEASDLLRQVKALSLELRADADNLDPLKRQKQINWRTHAFHLNYARDHVNEIGKRLARLQEIRASMDLWQERAIDEIVPVAKDLATHTQAAIQYLNADRNQIRTPIYREHLTSIQDHSKALHSSVDVYVDYHDALKMLENTQQKLERTQDKLEQLREKIGIQAS
jgi:hypothetical protein